MRVVLLLAVSLTLVGCGRKGPPLTPYVRIPAAPAPVDARRIGNDVFVTFTVPSTNVDQSAPADVRRVEVYGVSVGETRSPARLLEGAELVTVVGVAGAPPPGTPVAPPPPAGTLPPPDRVVPQQGDVVTVVDRLDTDDFTPQPLPVLPTRGPRGPAPPVAAVPAPPPRPQRQYVLVAFSGRGRAGPRGTPAIVSLDPAPPPPELVTTTYSATGVAVRWEPSGGLLGFLTDRQRPFEVLPLDDDQRRAVPAAPAVAPPGPTRYNVYGSLSPDPLVLPAAGASRPRWQQPAPRPLNPQPLDALEFADALVFERERCYQVRAVRGTGADAVEGAPADEVCVRPVDIFPPQPPGGLSSVAAEGTISLIWEASPSDDVAGYVVLRAESPGATLVPITPTPVIETRYVDRTVVSGVRYVYAVQAVDARLPVPNTSVPSGRIEDTAR